MRNRVRLTGDLAHPVVPAGAVHITRGGWGLKRSLYANPYPVRQYGLEASLNLYRQMLADRPELVEHARRHIGDADVACWCKPGAPCHGDLLLEAIHG